MKKALAYIRVSTEEQAEEGHHSLAAQRSTCTKTATEQGYEVVAVFEDPGRSATNMHRPGLRNLLVRCEDDSSIAAVFVQDTDRLARNTQDHLTIKAILAKHNVKLISASQPMLEDSAEGNMIDTIIASVNQFQSDITARKTLKGLHEKVRAGGWPGQAPLGYKNVTLQSGEHVIEVDPEGAPLVRELFRLYATGRFSVSALGEQLYSKGLRSRGGRTLHISKIYELLRNPFYVGEVHWDGIVAKGQHEPLIEPDLFKRVSEMLDMKRHFSSRARRHDFLLRGLIYCVRCTGLCVGEAHPKKHKSYYRCHTVGGCERCIDAAVAHGDVRERVAQLQLRAGFLDLVLQRVTFHADRHVQAVARRSKVLANTRNGLVEKKRTAGEKLLAGVLPNEDYAALRSSVDQQLQVVDGQLASLDRQKSFQADMVGEITHLAGNLGETYDRASNTLKRVYLALFWEKFIAQSGRIVSARPSRLYETMAEPNRLSTAADEASGVSSTAHKPVREGRAYVQRGDRHPNGPQSTGFSVRLASRWGRSPDVFRPFMELMLDGPYVQGLIAQLQEIRRLEKREGIERDPTPFSRAMSDTEDTLAVLRRVPDRRRSAWI